MDVRARPLDLKLNAFAEFKISDCAGLPDQMSEDEQKVVHKLLDMEGRRWM